MYKVLVIDVFYLIFQSYFAYSGLVFNGQSIGAFFGFVKKILNLLQTYKPDNLVFVSDTTEPTWRHKIFDQYKANRPEPQEDMLRQIPLILEWCQLVGSNFLSLPGYEADDLIASVCVFDYKNSFFKKKSLDNCKLNLDQTIQILIFSADKDLYQLLEIQDKQIAFIPVTNTQNLFTQENFRQKYQLKPYQWVDYKTLVGDNSDNLKGINGIGSKTAIKILQIFDSLENLFQLIIFLQKDLNFSDLDFLDEFCLSRNSQVYQKIREFYSQKTCAQVPSNKSNLPEMQNFFLKKQSFEILKKILKEKERLKFNQYLTRLQKPQISLNKNSWNLQAGLSLLQKYNFQSLIKQINFQAKNLQNKQEINFTKESLKFKVPKSQNLYQELDFNQTQTLFD